MIYIYNNYNILYILLSEIFAGLQQYFKDRFLAEEFGKVVQLLVSEIVSYAKAKIKCAKANLFFVKTKFIFAKANSLVFLYIKGCSQTLHLFTASFFSLPCVLEILSGCTRDPSSLRSSGWQMGSEECPNRLRWRVWRVEKGTFCIVITTGCIRGWPLRRQPIGRESAPGGAWPWNHEPSGGCLHNRPTDHR